MQLVVREQNQGPFFSQVLAYGQAEQLLTSVQLAEIKNKAVLMSLKFADKFYNKYKMHLLEQAAHDIIGVVSLGLSEMSGNDLAKALSLLNNADGVVKPFQKGWHMLSTSARKPAAANRYTAMLMSNCCVIFQAHPMPKNGMVYSNISKRWLNPIAATRLPW